VGGILTPDTDIRKRPNMLLAKALPPPGGCAGFAGPVCFALSRLKRISGAKSQKKYGLIRALAATAFFVQYITRKRAKLKEGREWAFNWIIAFFR